MPAGTRGLEVLRAADRAAVPWKNGGGVTREVTVFPPGAGLTDFDWRISIAEIGVAGPFSVFPGVDRLMAVLKGRLSLFIDGQPPVNLAPDTPAVGFPGDVPVFAEPLDATVMDLNVMTRRRRCRATLTRRVAGEAAVLESGGGTTVLIAVSGLKVLCGPLAVDLTPLDALVVGSDPVHALPADAGSASFELVEIR